jgi:transposase
MAKRRNPKAELLRRHQTLNPHPERVRDNHFLENDFFDAQDLLQVKYEMLRKSRLEGASVSQVAASFGFSRPSFYQARRDYEQEGILGLLPQRRGPRHGHKLTAEAMAFMEQVLREDDTLSAAALARLLQERLGIRVHRRSIERSLVRAIKKGR